MVEPKNPDSLAKGLWSALDEDIVMSLMKQSCRRKLTQHSYETILEELLSIYRSAEKGQVDRNE